MHMDERGHPGSPRFEITIPINYVREAGVDKWKKPWHSRAYRAITVHDFKYYVLSK